MDSSRILLAMTVLARNAANRKATDDIEAIISRPVVAILMAALNFRDAQVLGHARRVAMLAVGMAQQLGWEGRSLRILEASGLLHDIGKIGIADSILKKPGKLSDDEAEYIARYHRIACNLLQAFQVDPEVITIISQSHTYFNGTLDGSARIGKEMELGARVLAVADAYDSLTNDQAFRGAKSHEDAMAILHEGAGSRFDGNVVAALDRWAAGEGLQFIMDGADIKLSIKESAAASTSAVTEAGMLCHIFSYLNAIETLYDGFYVLDSDMRYVVWSADAEGLTGRPPSDMLGQPYSSGLIPIQDCDGRALDDQFCVVRKAIEGGVTTCDNVQLQHVDGTWKTVELQSIPLFDDNGQLRGVAQIFNGTNDGKSGSQYRDLKAAASRDPLTGIANRRELEEQVAAMFHGVEKSIQQGAQPQHFSVIFADIDHFKSLNDTHGHSFGDRVLIDFANALYEETFSGEFVSRYGGEEFVILVPDADIDATAKLAERLRQVVSRLRFDENPKVQITCSFGVAEVRSSDGPESLLKRADAALFEAKRLGRDRVIRGKDEKPVARSAVKNNQLEVVQHFEVCTQSDMIVYKLRGYVDETHADLKKVSRETVVMQLGKAGWFGKWGDEPSEQPVEMTLKIGGERDGRGAAKYVPVTVTVVPKGRTPDCAVFEYRARKVMESLRSFLVAR